MSQKIWSINGVELELDMGDLDAQERYENALELYNEEQKQISGDVKLSEFTRSACSLFKRLFDRIFGDGTSEKIFSGVPVNFLKYVEIYDKFIEFVSQQINENNAYITKKLAKYRPNRQQRRSKKK